MLILDSSSILRAKPAPTYHTLTTWRQFLFRKLIVNIISRGLCPLFALEPMQLFSEMFRERWLVHHPKPFRHTHFLRYYSASLLARRHTRQLLRSHRLRLISTWKLDRQNQAVSRIPCLECHKRLSIPRRVQPYWKPKPPTFVSDHQTRPFQTCTTVAGRRPRFQDHECATQ